MSRRLLRFSSATATSRARRTRIAERAGVSIGSLYEYFPSKDALVMELARRHIEEAGAVAWPTLARLRDDRVPLKARLEAIVWGFFTLHERSRLQEVLFEQSQRSEEVQALRADYFDRASAAIADYLIICPEVTVEDHALAGRMVAQVVEATAHGLVIQDHTAEGFARTATETVTMLERYLTPRR